MFNWVGKYIIIIGTMTRKTCCLDHAFTVKTLFTIDKLWGNNSWWYADSVYQQTANIVGCEYFSLSDYQQLPSPAVCKEVGI
jgi:hypothetical protein